jgi:1-phosphofructokinase family hexose kinase
MILTVTPNTGLDRTIVVPEFALNKTIRATREVLAMAGKGCDASWVLGKFGVPSLATGFAAGHTGEVMEAMLHTQGVQTDFVWTDGETRINIIVVHEPDRGMATFTIPSLEVSAQHIAELEAKFQSLLAGAGCVIFGGTLPPGVPYELYTRLVRAARAHGVPTVLDTSGPALVAGLEGCPTVIKPNQFELADVTGSVPGDLRAAYQAAQQVRQRFGCQVLVTMGAEGALAVFDEGDFFVPPLKLEVVSSAGAGDGVLAGMGWALDAGLPLVEGLKLGIGFASAIVLNLKTADYDPQDLERLRPQVKVLPYTP